MLYFILTCYAKYLQFYYDTVRLLISIAAGTNVHVQAAIMLIFLNDFDDDHNKFFRTSIKLLAFQLKFHPNRRYPYTQFIRIFISIPCSFKIMYKIHNG